MAEVVGAEEPTSTEIAADPVETPVVEAPVDPALAKLGNTRMLGIEIYTRYLYPLQIA